MGLPMAHNLHRAGLLTAVYNRSPDKARALSDETGCEAASDLVSMARLCDAVVLCVPADEDVLQITDALSETWSGGGLVIDCSTVKAETARRAAQLLTRCGAGFLDCPVSGGTEGARNATLAIMVGGEPAHFTKAQPVLRALGKSVELMGPTGAGQATKAVNQIMIAVVS